MVVNKAMGLFCLVYDDAAATSTYFTPHLNLEAWDIVKQRGGINDSSYTLKKIHSGESWILWARREQQQAKHLFTEDMDVQLSYWYWETPERMSALILLSTTQGLQCTSADIKQWQKSFRMK